MRRRGALFAGMPILRTAYALYRMSSNSASQARIQARIQAWSVRPLETWPGRRDLTCEWHERCLDADRREWHAPLRADSEDPLRDACRSTELMRMRYTICHD